MARRANGYGHFQDTNTDIFNDDTSSSFYPFHPPVPLSHSVTNVRAYDAASDRDNVGAILARGGTEPWVAAYRRTWVKLGPLLARLAVVVALWKGLGATPAQMAVAAVAYELALARIVYQMFLEDS